MAEFVLKTTNLTKDYAGKKAVDDVSMQIERGSIYGFIGKNGAGKTTIIKAILNMLYLDGGSITVFGQDHLRAEREIKARLGVVMDYTFFAEDWTPDAVEHAVAPFYPAWEKETYQKLLKKFSLPASQIKFKDLSHGMKTKLTTAAALSHGSSTNRPPRSALLQKRIFTAISLLLRVTKQRFLYRTAWA
jgi:ABC-2 type transport system ATP-binding protein